jgi:hypothetical protein
MGKISDTLSYLNVKVKKFLEFFGINILVHLGSIPPGHFYTQVLQMACNGVQRMQCGKWQEQRFLHQLMYRITDHLCINMQKYSCERPTTVLSRCHPEWHLAVPYKFRSHGGRHIKCDSSTVEESKRSPLTVLPTMERSMEQVCIFECAQGSYFEGY